MEVIFDGTVIYTLVFNAPMDAKVYRQFILNLLLFDEIVYPFIVFIV